MSESGSDGGPRFCSGVGTEDTRSRSSALEWTGCQVGQLSDVSVVNELLAYGGSVQPAPFCLEFAGLSDQTLALCERHARFASQLLLSPFERIEVRSHAEHVTRAACQASD